MGQAWIAISAVISALAALSIAVLTFFLVRATNRYVAETAKYVHLVQAQLNLLRAQLTAPLLLDVTFFPGTIPQLTIKCRHSGNSSSLAVILKSLSLQLEPNAGDELSEKQNLNDILGPGRAKTLRFSSQLVSAIARLPSPNLWLVIIGRELKEQSVARFTVSLAFERAGEPENLTREYEVRTHHLGGPTFVPL